MKTDELKKLARMRVRESKVLLAAKEYCGAYYLAGYAIECSLKAVVSKKFEKSKIPDKRFVNDIYTHKLDDLLRHADLKSQFEADCRTNPDLAANWMVIKDWSEERRYSVSISKADATDIYAAITERGNGVLKWIFQHI